MFSAATLDRIGVGVEINPVGYVYARAKLAPASRCDVEVRLDEIARQAKAKEVRRTAAALPEFFHHCFSHDVRRLLVAARNELDWRRTRVDRTVMSLLLVHLHGKAESALSNQLRQTKAMSPQYAIRWWKKRRMSPPQIDACAFMKARLAWRYAKGVPAVRRGAVYLGDSGFLLAKLLRDGAMPKADLLFTSPPYFCVTNYHYDQWLRLWLLGFPPNALRNGNGRGGKFEAREKYKDLL